MFDDGPAWEDDNYSKADDTDKKPDDAVFRAIDGPGHHSLIRDAWNINYSMTLQQAVYDTGRKQWVAATPPETIKVLGVFPRKYLFVWGGGIHGVQEKTGAAQVTGVAGQHVLGHTNENDKQKESILSIGFLLCPCVHLWRFQAIPVTCRCNHAQPCSRRIRRRERVGATVGLDDGN